MKPIPVIDETPFWEKIQHAIDQLRADGFANADLSDAPWSKFTEINFPFIPSDSSFEGDGEYEDHLEKAVSQTLGLACAQAVACGAHVEAERLWDDLSTWCAIRQKPDFSGVDVFITHCLLMGTSEFILPYTDHFLCGVTNKTISMDRDEVMWEMHHILDAAILSSGAIDNDNKGLLLNQVIDHWRNESTIDDQEQSELAASLVTDALRQNAQDVVASLLTHQALNRDNLSDVLFELSNSHMQQNAQMNLGGPQHVHYETIWNILIGQYELNLQKTIDTFPFHQLGEAFHPSKSSMDDEPIFELKDLLYADKDRHAVHQLNKYRRSRHEMKGMLKFINRLLPILMDQFPDDLAPPQLQMFLQEEKDLFEPSKHQSLWARAQSRVLYDQTSDLGHEGAPKKPKM